MTGKDEEERRRLPPHGLWGADQKHVRDAGMAQRVGCHPAEGCWSDSESEHVPGSRARSPAGASARDS